MNLFEMFGLQEEVSQVAKAEAKQKKPKAKKTGAKKSNSKVEAIAYPITIYTGYKEPYVLEGEGTITDKELKKKVHELFPEYCEYNMGFKVRGSKVYVSTSGKGTISKGMITVDKDTKLMFANHVFDISSVLTDERCQVEVEELSKCLALVHPAFKHAAFYRQEKENIITCYISVPELLESEKLEFPIKVSVIGRENFVVDECDLADGYSKEALKTFLLEKYPEFKGFMRLAFDAESEVVIPLFVVPMENKGSNQDKKLFPTTGTKISFIFNKIELEPELFDGREEVEESDILAFIQKDYPEYSKERTTIEYDEKNKLIIPVLKGAKKGALKLTRQEVEDLKNSSDYALGTIVENGKVSRVENTFVSFTKANDYGEGEFIYHIKKIPCGIISAIKDFYAKWTADRQREALIRVYYNVETEDYEVRIPRQIVSSVSVEVDEVETVPGKILVLETHSHGNIDAFFSAVDNSDELGNKIYGVFGGFNGCACQVLYRAGTGGKFLFLEEEEFLSFEQKDVEYYFEARERLEQEQHFISEL